MDIHNLLESITKDVLSDEHKTQIKEAFNSAIDTKAKELFDSKVKDLEEVYAEKVQKFANQIDENHATAMEELVETIDKDHTKKMNVLIRELDKSYVERLKAVKEHYENSLVKEVDNFKNTLLETVEKWIELKIDESIPAQVFHEAAQNFVNKQKVNESVKAPKKSIIASLTAKLPKDKALYVESKLNGKSESFVKRNFNFVCEMFDKKQQKEKEMLTEAARKVTINSRKELLAENESEMSENKEVTTSAGPVNSLVAACVQQLKAGM